MTDLHQINDKLLEIIGSLGAAEMQASACDDQIIIGHLRDAYRDTIALRRQVFAAVREAEAV